MAVCTRLRFDGGTPRQHQSIDAHLNVRTDPPEGLILHASGPVEGGWAVFDVWESHDAFERFAASRAFPAGSIPDLPEIEEFTVAEVVQPDRSSDRDPAVSPAGTGPLRAVDRAPAGPAIDRGAWELPASTHLRKPPCGSPGDGVAPCMPADRPRRGRADRPRRPVADHAAV